MNKNSYAHAQWNALCDVCGFKYKSTDLRKRWDGLMCCEYDWEPRHPSDFFRSKPDNQSVPWIRNTDGSSGGTDINGNVFPPAENTTATDPGIEPGEADTFDGNL